MASMPVTSSPIKRRQESPVPQGRDTPPAKRPRSEGEGAVKPPSTSPAKEDAKASTSPSKAGPKLAKLDVAAAAGRAQGKEGEGEGEGTPLFDTPTTPHPSREAAEAAKALAEAEERERMQLLVSSFTEDQLDRYAMYRRAALPKATIKKVMQTIAGTSVGHNVIIAMAGIAKVFAGEVVEEALKTLDEMGESGQPLRPKHLREALRRMRTRGAYVPKSKKSCPFT